MVILIQLEITNRFTPALLKEYYKGQTFFSYEEIPDYPPPPPTFLVYTHLPLISLFVLAKELSVLNQAPQQLLPLPTFLALSINYLSLLNFAILATTDHDGTETVIHFLFPAFRARRNRCESCHILVYACDG